MIVVYTGRMLSGNFQQKRFLPGVPTWLPDVFAAELYRRNDFEIYDPEKPGHSALGEPVYVFVPTDLNLALACRRGLEKIQSLFPTCPIEVQAPSEYARLLPSFCTRIETKTGKPYYREFQIDSSTSPATDPGVYQYTPWSLSMLTALGVVDLKDREKISAPYYLENWEPRRNHAVIVSNLFKGGEVRNVDHSVPIDPKAKELQSLAIYEHHRQTTIDDGTGEFASAVAAMLKKRGYEVTHLQYTVDRDRSAIDTILSAEIVVACTDSPLSYLAMVAGCKTFVFRSWSPKFDFWGQYKFFKNAIPVTFGDAQTWGDRAARVESVLDSGERIEPPTPPGSPNVFDPDKKWNAKTILKDSAEQAKKHGARIDPNKMKAVEAMPDPV